MAGFTREELQSYARGKRAEFEYVLEKIVEIPSVSVEPGRKGDVHRAGRIRRHRFSSRSGRRRRLYETKGHPIVYGRFDRGPSYPTVTVYNHLDVQPAEGPDWKTEPLRLHPRGRQVPRTRHDRRQGAGDHGALRRPLCASSRAVPLNIHFLWELEEEIGSPHFETTIRDKAKQFATEFGRGFGHRLGLARASGLPRGPARASRASASTCRRARPTSTPARPAARRATRSPSSAQLIAECVDGKTGKVKIPGFYKDVVPPTKKELEDLKKCGFTVKDFKQDHLFRSLRVNDALEVMKRIWMMPTFEVHGIAGGYQGPGVKTIIPPKATAIVSCRLVPEHEVRRRSSSSSGTS